MKSYTIADIAEKCGVSKATVSRVINKKPKGVGEETRNRVLQVIEEYNFRPNSIARSFMTSKTKMAGLIIPDASNLFYPMIIRGVCDALESKGYSMILCNSDGDPKREAQQLLSMVDRRVEGVILCSGVSNREFLSKYSRYGIPLVTIGRIFDIDFSQASITGNNYSGARVATRFLLDGGNEHIYFIDGVPGTTGTMQRKDGFFSMMAEAGRAVKPWQVYLKEFSFEYGADVVRRLLRDKRPVSAIFAGSDLIAIGVLAALAEHHIAVPQKVEVVGFDDTPLAVMQQPQLTTVHKPHVEMAEKAVELLLGAIDGTIGEIRHLTVDSHLVIRGTTRPR